MRNGDRKKWADRRRGQDTERTDVRELGGSIFPACAAFALPVFTHSLSVTLHCCSGDSVVVVKGEIKTAVPPRGVLALGTDGAKILLLLSVLTAVVVADLLVKSAGCAVAAAGRNRVAGGETAVVRRDLAAADGVVVVSWKEAVMVSCGGGRGDT